MGRKRREKDRCQMKRDSEIKILVGCTEEEKLEVYKTHNETQYMKGVLIRR